MLHTLDNALPVRKTSSITKLVVFLFLSTTLMLLDHNGQYLQVVRNALSVLVYPVQIVAEIPSDVAESVSGLFESDEVQTEALVKLKTERLLLLAKLQKLQALEKENIRLRKMLESSSKVTDRAVVAELLQVHPDPFTRKIVINRGSKHGVYIGQPVIDSFGILGQVTRVNLLNSTVTLITDSSHAIPVMVNRNGLRTIIMGTGAQDTVKIPFLSSSVNVEEGDLLVSSGMGNTFPEGYPVATISKISSDPNEAFLDIEAKPLAKLNNNKEVLLIWPGKQPAPVGEEGQDDAG
ncbi:MAG: rod shape-determining protein MreC [Acidiferrobacterales bacterium]